MKITLSKNLDIQQLYEDIVEGDFDGYYACDEINLSKSDLTPNLMAQIFSALADEANKRIAKLEAKEKKERA